MRLFEGLEFFGHLGIGTNLLVRHAITTIENFVITLHLPLVAELASFLCSFPFPTCN